MAAVKVEEAALVTEVVNKVIVMEIEGYTATPREITSIVPTTLVNKI